MDITQILDHLKVERQRIDHAISALEGSHSHSTAVVKHTSAKKKAKGGITPAGRKKLSEMMKKRWAARRAASGATGKKK